MFLKVLAVAAVLMVSEGTMPEEVYYRRAPVRFLLNNRGRRPGAGNWNYQVINGRPVISGFPNSNSFVTFGLNPQTGQIEQTQILTQTRPGGPFVNLIQNMLQVAGQFFGQITGAFGNAAAGALHTAGQFGQDVQDLRNPVISVTGVSQTAEGKEPLQQPGAAGPASLPLAPSTLAPAAPSTETLPDAPKSEFPTPVSTLDQAIISLQTFRTNIRANLESYLETSEGETAFRKVKENIEWAVNKLESLRESAVAEPEGVLQTGQSTVNTAVDNIESAVVGVVGPRGGDFIRPTRNELNKLFSDALTAYESDVAPTAETVAVK